MRRLPTPLIALAVCGVVIALAAVAGAALTKAPSNAPSEQADAFYSAAVRGTVHLTILLPAGYRAGSRRYPVVYFLHGLPASSQTYRNVGFLRDALAGVRRPAILVAPQGARDTDTDPEYLDWGPGRNWETAVAQELPAYIDAHYRTIANRRGRALVGLSAGGYGAVSLAIHHLESFSVIESWSGYFHPTDPSGTSSLDLGSASRNQRADIHSYVGLLRQEFLDRPTFFGFYVGSNDTRFRQENLLLHQELVAAGVPHVFKLYPGAHEERVWRDHARLWLGLALANLVPATAPATANVLLPGFIQIASGTAGGSIWKGRIPDHAAPWDRRRSAVYLPPLFDPSQRYPLAVLLHGFPGSPSGFYDSLQLADVADQLILTGKIAPFIAVMPVAGRVSGPRSDEEWAGPWETYVIGDVLPWAAAHLPLERKQSERMIGGVSSGGYGAVDIALRHPGRFGIVESWAGYFHPFRDGPFTTATQAQLDDHDPSLLVRREAAALRQQQVRFFLSTGFAHGGILRSWTFAFQQELRSLGLRTRVWASSKPDAGAYLRRQLPDALEFAFGA
ncbi:MAG TPA: alpha/beta hydrolase-fold protein [Gaiellaceae bacterium]